MSNTQTSGKPRRWRSFSRSLVGAVALILPLTVTLPAGAITRCQVLADAQQWVDAQVPYSQSTCWNDPMRDNYCYRTDCSGFVSAVWGLGYSYTTYDFPSPAEAGNELAYRIDPSELLPGDALNYHGDISDGTGHIVLFVEGSWVEGGSAVIYEEPHSNAVAQRRVKAFDGKFIPIRYRNIEPCEPEKPPFNNKLPAQVTGNSAISLLNWTSSGQWLNDGHAELFAIQGGNLVHTYTHGNNDDWVEPLALSQGPECGFASAYWPAPKSYPEIFVPNKIQRVTHQWLKLDTITWTEGEGFGDVAYTQLSTLAWNDGRVEVFALGPDKAIWHRYWDPATNFWSAWVSLGGNFASGAAPILWTDEHAEIFATDVHGRPWHNWSGIGTYASGWHGWEKMDGELSSRPMPVRWSDGHFDVFARGGDERLHKATLLNDAGGVWTPFKAVSPGTTFDGEPSVAMNPAGAGTPEGPEVFVRGKDGKVLHLWFNGGGENEGYHAFEPLLDQTTSSDPFVWRRDDDTLEVFTITPDGDLKYSRRDGNKIWGEWKAIAGDFSPCAIDIDVSNGTYVTSCSFAPGAAPTGLSLGMLVILGLGLVGSRHLTRRAQRRVRRVRHRQTDAEADAEANGN